MSPWGVVPRLGTAPRLGENDSVSDVRLSSRMLSMVAGGVGGGGLIGSGVGVTVLSGRKMVFKPGPVNVPVKAAIGPRLGAGAVRAVAMEVPGMGTSVILNPLGNERVACSSPAGDVTSSLLAMGRNSPLCKTGKK